MIRLLFKLGIPSGLLSNDGSGLHRGRCHFASVVGHVGHFGPFWAEHHSSTSTHSAGANNMAAAFSCKRCYARKVKCDRTSPRCGACTKANAECSPAVNTRTQPALRKRFREAELHDARETRLVQRIERLEGYLERLGIDLKSLDDVQPIETRHGATKSSFNFAPGYADLATNQINSGVQVVDDPSIEAGAMMEMFMGKYDHVYKPGSVDRRALVAGISNAFARKYKADGTEWLLGAGESDGIMDQHPDAYHIFHLWSVYRYNVQPLTQLVYEPLIDEILLQKGPALKRIDGDGDATVPLVEARDHAILFAIYHAALQTMDPDAVTKTFGRSSEDLTNSFRSATRHWLHQAQYCRTMDVQVLQALVIHLVALDHAVDPRSMIPLIALAKAIARRMHAFLTPPTPVDPPSLDLDLVRRAWWALVALEDRVEDRGGDIGQQSSEAIEDGLPLPTLVGDSALSIHPGSALDRGSGSQTITIGTSSKTFVRIRYEILSLTARLRKGNPDDANVRLRTELSLIDEFQRSLQSRYFNAAISQDHTVKFAHMWLLECMDDLRLSVGLRHERRIMLYEDQDDLRPQQINNLEQCMASLEQFVAIHQELFFQSAGWYHQITSWVGVLLHLFRLCRLLVPTDEDLVRRAWGIVDANYPSTLGGVALRREPTKPGTLDKAMLGAWDEGMTIAASRSGWSEPKCVQQARARTESVCKPSGALPHVTGSTSGSSDNTASRTNLTSFSGPPPTVYDSFGSLDPFNDLGWSQPFQSQDWYLWQDAM